MRHGRSPRILRSHYTQWRKTAQPEKATVIMKPHFLRVNNFLRRRDLDGFFPKLSEVFARLESEWVRFLASFRQAAGTLTVRALEPAALSAYNSGQ
jgi:hypothetical protein